MWSAVGSTGLHPRTTAYCNSDGRFTQIASWQYCSMAWPTLLDCRLRELRRNHCATAGQAQTRTYPGQRSSTGSCVPYRFRLDTGPKERLSEPRGWAVIKPDDLRSGNHHRIGVSILFLGNQEGPADVWPGGTE